jgi:hypothetical protein
MTLKNCLQLSMKNEEILYNKLNIYITKKKKINIFSFRNVTKFS